MSDPSNPTPSLTERESMLRLCDWIITYDHSSFEALRREAIEVARAFKARLQAEAKAEPSAPPGWSYEWDEDLQVYTWKQTKAEPAAGMPTREIYIAKEPVADEDIVKWESAAKHAKPLDLRALDETLRVQGSSVPAPQAAIESLRTDQRQLDEGGVFDVLRKGVLALEALNVAQWGERAPVNLNGEIQ